MRHRIGSITKTFTAAAVLQLVESGEIELGTPIYHYLPQLLPGERGNMITVRMLINHTSGLADYLPFAYPSLKAFPSLKDTTPQSLDDHRFRRFHPTDLIEFGVRAPAVGKPGGAPGIYSNTNYQFLCQLLERVTGMTAEDSITRNVIERAELRDSPAASLISTVADLDRFYGLLLAGEIVNASSLAQMQCTVPVISFEGKKIEYGLGLHKMEIPGHGTFCGMTARSGAREQ